VQWLPQTGEVLLPDPVLVIEMLALGVYISIVACSVNRILFRILIKLINQTNLCAGSSLGSENSYVSEEANFNSTSARITESFIIP
jgi:hypothetical protein